MGFKWFSLHRNVPLLFAIRLCRAATVNLIWTTWPLYVRSLGASVYETSLVWALGAVVDLGLLIPCAAVSDRFGRKKAMLLSLAFIIVPNFAYTRATSWNQLIPFKMLATVAGMLFAPAEMAMITDISVSKERGRTFSLVQIAHPIGSIPSPIIGGWILDNYGWNAVFYSIIFAAVLAIVPALLLTETKVKTQKTEVEVPTSSRSNPAKKLGNPSVYPLALAFLFNTFRSIDAYSQITPIYLQERFNVDNVQQGLFFSIGTMVVNLLIELPAGWLADKYSRRKIVLVSCIAEPLATVFWPSMSSYETLIVLRMILQSTNTIAQPAVKAYLMDFTEASKRGLSGGVFQLGSTLGGSVLGTTLMGYAYETFGITAPYYIGALFGLPSIPVILLLGKKIEEMSKKRSE